MLSGGELGVAPQSQERLKDTLRELTSRSAGQSLPKVIQPVNQKFTGWIQYFRMARMKSFMQDIGQWLRRRLRCLRLKQCKRTSAIARFLMELGESRDSAWKLAASGKGWWRMADTPQSHRAMSLSWFKDTGLLDPEAVYHFVETLVNWRPPVPSRHAGWCERGGGASLPPISIVLGQKGRFQAGNGVPWRGQGRPWRARGVLGGTTEVRGRTTELRDGTQECS